MSSEIPKADPELQERITDALRSQLRREPTSAEVGLALEQWRRVDAINNRNKVFWDEQSPQPSPPSPEAVIRADAQRITMRAVLAEAGRNRVRKAAQKRRETGNATLERVRLEAIKYNDGPLSRERVAQLVAPVVGLSEAATLKLLRKLKIPT